VEKSLGTIYDAIHNIEKKIVEIQTIQKLRHEENQRALSQLEKTIGMRFSWIYGIVVSVVIGGIVFGIWVKAVASG